MFCAKLYSYNQLMPPTGHTHWVTDAVTGIKGVGYNLCFGCVGSGTQNLYSALLNFAKSRELRITGLCSQRCDHMPHMIWCDSAGSVAEEVDHILASTYVMMVQECSLFFEVVSSLPLTIEGID